MYMNMNMKYFVRFSYPSILLIFEVIDCLVVGMFLSYIIITIEIRNTSHSHLGHHHFY